MNSRESIYSALFGLASANADFKTTGRRLKHIEELDPSSFPAFFQVQVDEDWKQDNGQLPPVGQLHVEWWVYVYGTDETQAHDIALNGLVDSVLASVGLPPNFNPDNQTISGAVESVRLSGKIEYAEGAMADRAFARVPLVIHLPG
ncbi:MAG TPA: hypothetical protein VKA32_01420 [Gammaproteobacteria bacterium]|nr:hypothetical protein [Gammaproteobacteria bacterium]